MDQSQVPSVHLYYYRGLLSLKTCRYQAAIKALRRAVALAPRWPRLRLALGDALASQ
ncbi:MAG: tetratricopeptide repeat protein, partial [Chloroflexi bacterium]